jgi:hypothetical protein
MAPRMRPVHVDGAVECLQFAVTHGFHLVAAEDAPAGHATASRSNW